MATSLQRIEEYEELFKNRYTELDDDYRETIRKGQRFSALNVTVYVHVYLT